MNLFTSSFADKFRFLSSKFKVHLNLIFYKSVKSLIACFGFFMCAAVMANNDYPQLVFEEALHERTSGDLQKAIEGFRSILKTDPTLQRARLELAVTYYLALNFSAARQEAETVLNDPKTPEEVKKRVQVFLDKIVQDSKPHHWKPFIGLGFIHDSNANVGPDKTTFNLSDTTTITLIDAATENSDQAFTGEGGIVHRYLFPETTRILGQDAALLWVSQADIYTRTYFDETDENLEIFGASTGPLAIAARKWRGRFNFSGNYLRRGSETYAYFLGINPSITTQFFEQRAELTWNLLIQKRDFKQRINEGQDGVFGSTGLYYHYVLPGDKYSFNSQLLYFTENTDVSHLSNSGGQIGFGADASITEIDKVFVHFSRRWTSFDSTDPVFGISRKDDLDRLVIGYNHTFKSGFIKSWTFSASVAYDERDSNIKINEYDRIQAGFKIRRSF